MKVTACAVFFSEFLPFAKKIKIMPKEAEIVGGVQNHNLYDLFLDQFFMLISKIILIFNNFQSYYGYWNFEPFWPRFKPIRLFNWSVCQRWNSYGIMLKLGYIMKHFLGQNSRKKIWKRDPRWSENCLALQYGETHQIFIFLPFFFIFVQTLLGSCCLFDTKYLWANAETWQYYGRLPWSQFLKKDLKMGYLLVR